MNYSLSTIAYFDKQFKRLSKKYPSLKTDLTNLAQQLIANQQNNIFLLSIYDKSGQPAISDKEMLSLLDSIK